MECVTIKNNLIKGTNTDWTGFENSLNHFQKNKKNKTKIQKRDSAIVIGYGGSAKAIIYSLKSLGYKKIMEKYSSFKDSTDMLRKCHLQHFLSSKIAKISGAPPRTPLRGLVLCQK